MADVDGSELSEGSSGEEERKRHKLAAVFGTAVRGSKGFFQAVGDKVRKLGQGCSLH